MKPPLNNRKFIISALLLAALATAAGSYLAGYRYYPQRHPNSLDYKSAREFAILSQVAEIDHPVTLMLGDSITELAYLPSVCDGAIFNSGVGGATLATISDLAPRIIKLVRPSAIIIAIGTNDANWSAKTAPDAFASQYKALIDEFRATGAKVYAATIPPIARKGESIIDPTHIVKLNRIIESVAKATSTPLIEFYSGMQPLDGFLPDDLTIDGVHLSPAGYSRWLRTLSSACL